MEILPTARSKTFFVTGHLNEPHIYLVVDTQETPINNGHWKLSFDSLYFTYLPKHTVVKNCLVALVSNLTQSSVINKFGNRINYPSPIAQTLIRPEAEGARVLLSQLCNKPLSFKAAPPDGLISFHFIWINLDDPNNSDKDFNPVKAKQFHANITFEGILRLTQIAH